jgi:site-specific recombinase XerD
MAAAGVPLPVLQELMGHADVKTTRRYIHVGEQEKRAAIASAWHQP